MRFEISLLVESSPTDRAAVRFLSCMDQLVPLELVGMREFFAACRTVVLDLLFGLLQELRRDVYRDAHHFSTRALLPFVVKEGEITQLHYNAYNITKQTFQNPIICQRDSMLTILISLLQQILSTPSYLSRCRSVFKVKTVIHMPADYACRC